MSMLFANMGSYDWIIFVMAAVNGAVFAVAERSAKSLYESLLPRMEAKAPAPAGAVFIRAGQNHSRQPGLSAEKERYCVKCKEKLSPGSKFCENCGTKAEN